MSKFSNLYEQVFGEKYQKESYKYVAHSFNRTIVGKQYCSKCGLMALNNSFTRWAIDKGCMNYLHPSYRNQWKKSGGT